MSSSKVAPLSTRWVRPAAGRQVFGPREQAGLRKLWARESSEQRSRWAGTVPATGAQTEPTFQGQEQSRGPAMRPGASLTVHSGWASLQSQCGQQDGWAVEVLGSRLGAFPQPGWVWAHRREECGSTWEDKELWVRSRPVIKAVGGHTPRPQACGQGVGHQRAAGGCDPDARCGSRAWSPCRKSCAVLGSPA